MKISKTLGCKLKLKLKNKQTKWKESSINKYQKTAKLFIYFSSVKRKHIFAFGFYVLFLFIFIYIFIFSFIYTLYFAFVIKVIRFCCCWLFQFIFKNTQQLTIRKKSLEEYKIYIKWVRDLLLVQHCSSDAKILRKRQNTLLLISLFLL